MGCCWICRPTWPMAMLLDRLVIGLLFLAAAAWNGVSLCLCVCRCFCRCIRCDRRATFREARALAGHAGQSRTASTEARTNRRRSG